MLLRAAGRRPHRTLPCSHFATDVQPLHLPFLWPARLLWRSTHTRQPARPPRSTSINLHDAIHPQARHIASVAEPSEPIPFEMYGTLNQNLIFPPSSTWTSYPRLIDARVQLPAPQPPETTTRRSALGNNARDLLQNLYACLRVGRTDRAKQIIKRMALLPEVADAEVMHAHSTYLEHCLEDDPELQNPRERLDEMVTHFQTQDIESRPDSSEASVLVMRAALALADDAQQQQEEEMELHARHQVKRFLDLSGLSVDAIKRGDYLTSREYIIMQRIVHDKPLDDITGEIEQQETDESQADQHTATEEPGYTLTVDDIPAILQVMQKGVGISSLKDVLKVQESHYEENGSTAALMDPGTAYARNLEREKLLEDTAAEAALARWKAEEEQLQQSAGVDSVLTKRSLNSLMWKWYSALVPVLEQELADVKRRLTAQSRPDKPPCSDGPREDADYYGAYLEQLTPHKLAVNTVISLMSDLVRARDPRTREYTNSVRLQDATKTLGKVLESEVSAAVMRTARTKSKQRSSTQAGAATRPSDIHPPTERSEWPLHIKARVGSMLMSKFVQVATMLITREHPRTKEAVTRMRPAFAIKVTYAKGKKHLVLAACPELQEKMRKEPTGSLICKRLPMLVEPNKWEGFRKGGYINHPTDFVRIPNNEQTPRNYVSAAIERGHMDDVFKAITALGRTGWRINEDVLRVQIEAWNTGEAIGNFAPLDPKFDMPAEPPPSSNPNVRQKWAMEMREIENRATSLHSQRCYQNLQLEIARSFRHDTMYFPHNVDFRGRAYPLSVYLNHMNADNVRGVLIFAKGKELGQRGLRWLKIHLANVFGYDKASFSEREQFVMDHLEDIRDSVENPISGRRWWCKSDDVWQTLAACYELKHALDCPDPTKFVSRLPIQQDGTCNGLQHYAALGGDEVGARQVNLVPGDRPSDVYTAVAEGVIRSVKEDVAKGNPIARILDGRITRKVVKQPVMTNVYGVTEYGARAQIKKQIEVIFPEIKTTSFINHQTLANYVARKTFRSLGEMFKGAEATQHWLLQCADRISTSITSEQIASYHALAEEAAAASIESNEGVNTSRKSPAKAKKMAPKSSDRSRSGGMGASFKSTVIWTTPLQFPVVQPYREPSARFIKTAVLNSMALPEPQGWDPVSHRKQMQGFPPNFIHSLDATHMMLSAIKCEERGMTFAAIHDSFWTHACDRDELAQLLRDAFVHMHREDIIGRLKEEFEARYEGCMQVACINGSSAAGKKIAEWRKSNDNESYKKLKKALGQTKAEAALEHDRVRLLRSTDPVERQRGLDMVTPASIYEAAGGSIDTSYSTGVRNQANPSSGLFGGVDPPPEEDAETPADPEANADGTEHETAAAAAPDEPYDSSDPVRSHEFSDDEAWLEQRRIHGHQMSDGRLRDLLVGPSTKPRVQYLTKKLFIWLPLTFPAVPERGKFDVSTLRESKYFFH